MEVENSTCPDLTGSFLDLGDPDPSESGVEFRLQLSHILAPEIAQAYAVHHVDITRSDQKALTVEVWQDQLVYENGTITSNGVALLGERTLLRKDGDYSCSNGAVVLALGSGCIGPAEQVTVACESHAMELKKGSDGALILRKVSNFAGVVMLAIPVAGSERHWHRFPPNLPEQAGPAPSPEPATPPREPVSPTTVDVAIAGGDNFLPELTVISQWGAAGDNAAISREWRRVFVGDPQQSPVLTIVRHKLYYELVGGGRGIQFRYVVDGRLFVNGRDHAIHGEGTRIVSGYPDIARDQAVDRGISDVATKVRAALDPEDTKLQ